MIYYPSLPLEATSLQKTGDPKQLHYTDSATVIVVLAGRWSPSASYSAIFPESSPSTFILKYFYFAVI